MRPFLGISFLNLPVELPDATLVGMKKVVGRAGCANRVRLWAFLYLALIRCKVIFPSCLHSGRPGVPARVGTARSRCNPGSSATAWWSVASAERAWYAGWLARSARCPSLVLSWARKKGQGAWSFTMTIPSHRSHESEVSGLLNPTAGAASLATVGRPTRAACATAAA